jgi:hypothetical protein
MWNSMTFEVKLHLITNLRNHNVSIHVKILLDQILKKKDIQEKFIFKYRNDLVTFNNL